MPIADHTTDLLQGWGTAASAVFTAVAAIVAVFAVTAAVRAYRAQNQQLDIQRQQLADQQRINERQSEILDLQAEELRESIADRRRVALEARRSQAAQVFCWLYSDGTAYQGVYGWTINVKNTSYQPIYDIHARWWQGDSPWHFLHNEGDYPNPQERISPDVEIRFRARLEADSGVDPSSVSAFVEFRDAAEVWWRIRPDGRIEEIPQPPDIQTT